MTSPRAAGCTARCMVLLFFTRVRLIVCLIAQQPQTTTFRLSFKSQPSRIACNVIRSEAPPSITKDSAAASSRVCLGFIRCAAAAHCESPVSFALPCLALPCFALPRLASPCLRAAGPAADPLAATRQTRTDQRQTRQTRQTSAGPPPHQQTYSYLLTPTTNKTRTRDSNTASHPPLLVRFPSLALHLQPSSTASVIIIAPGNLMCCRR